MHRFSNHLSRAILVLSTCLVLAACGDGAMSKSAYVKENNAIQEKAQKAMADFGASSDPSKIEGSIDKARATLDAAADDLEALDPPKDWADEHADLLEALRGMSTQMTALAKAAGDKDVEALTKATTEMQKLQEQASKAISAMNADR